ncbi:MAG: hypothetical protein A2Z25_11570 [Planctomycetes bacterium RBG_16_55_9]|nr:MAG: hypothetical protein A2Z25_11570 [Planctomycetes bacterium RBG_16_55_9]
MQILDPAKDRRKKDECKYYTKFAQSCQKPQNTIFCNPARPFFSGPLLPLERGGQFDYTTRLGYLTKA